MLNIESRHTVLLWELPSCTTFWITAAHAWVHSKAAVHHSRDHPELERSHPFGFPVCDAESSKGCGREGVDSPLSVLWFLYAVHQLPSQFFDYNWICSPQRFRRSPNQAAWHDPFKRVLLKHAAIKLRAQMKVRTHTNTDTHTKKSRHLEFTALDWFIR